jgi:hypothetical protein
MQEGMSMLLGGLTGLLGDAALGGRSAKGLALSAKGDALSLTGVPHSGVELPLRPPIDSIDPRDLYECCLFRVPELEESSVELLDFRRLCLRVRVPELLQLIGLGGSGAPSCSSRVSPT